MELPLFLQSFSLPLTTVTTSLFRHNLVCLASFAIKLKDLINALKLAKVRSIASAFFEFFISIFVSLLSSSSSTMLLLFLLLNMQ